MAIVQKIIQPNMATYHYKKVEKKKTLSIFLTTYWNLLLKYGNLDFVFIFFLETWQIWAIFSMKNRFFVQVEIILFRSKLDKSGPQKTSIFLFFKFCIWVKFYTKENIATMTNLSHGYINLVPIYLTAFKYLTQYPTQ